MSESRNHFFFELLVLLCCISFQDVSGTQMKLIRDKKGDYFTNPYSTTPSASKFCDLRNATCFNEGRRGNNAQCSHCKCNVVTFKTFNKTSLRCAPIQDFGQGCRTWLREKSVKLLDLTGNGTAKLQTDSDKDVKSLNITSMEFNFFKVKRIRKKQDDSRKKRDAHDSGDDRWKVTIEWNNVPKNSYDGQVFRVQISYEIVGDDSNRNDCFVFKSKGNITVTFRTTTPPLPSTSEKLTIQTSPSHREPSTTTITASPTTTAITASPTTTTITASPTTTTITASPTDSVSNTVFTNEISTSTVSSSDQFGSSNGTGKEERSGGGSNAVAVSLAVVGCLLLLGAILAVLWFRRRSARTSEDKSREISFKNGNVKNSMKMSQPESVYAEAESSITSADEDEDNLEYDYADGNLKNYASLDMTKVESKPVYQSLINVEKDLNKHIPSESGETLTAEPFYHVVEGEDRNQHPGEIYHVLEDPEKSDNCETQDAPGMTGHENPAYSTLEEDAPETCDREVSEGTGDDNPERVYSVLEN